MKPASMPAPLLQWCRQQWRTDFNVQALPNQASARRYYRCQSGKTSYVVMDASMCIDALVQQQAVGKVFTACGVRVPRIEAVCLTKGYALLEDFGDDSLLSVVQSQNSMQYYHAAFKVIAQLQACPADMRRQYTEFGSADFQRKQRLFCESFLTPVEAEAIAAPLAGFVARLNKRLQAQPQVLIHRDFHAANCYWLGDDQPLGVIDFQSAMQGPIAYDLASLLQDAYVTWPEAEVQRFIDIFYYEYLAADYRAQVPQMAFRQSVWQLAALRHMKCLGLFMQLSQKADTQPYRRYLPTLLDYLRAACERDTALAFLQPYLPGLQQRCIGLEN